MASSSERSGRRLSAVKDQITIHEYFQLPETMQPMELLYGVVHEPPPPSYGHQAVVTTLTVLLKIHVDRERLGIVCVSPVDVVLDRERALVVQPDIIFVAASRKHIIRDRIYGAPDLVVEVMSPGTARRDRTIKLRWYREYGVRECWLVDEDARRIEIVCLDDPSDRRRIFFGSQHISSRVLPDFAVPVASVFE